MGQSRQEKEYNRQMAKNAESSRKMQEEMFKLAKEGTPEEQKFREGAKRWDTFVAGKDYSKPPAGEILNFDLWNPAQVRENQARMADLTGIGAAALGGSGDQSLALQLARERNAEVASQMAGQSYENSIKALDAYYKGNNLAYAQLGAQTNMNLLGNATSSSQFFYDQQRATLPKNFWGQLGMGLIGGAFRAGGALLGNPGLFKK